jgi:hypothetical protein
MTIGKTRKIYKSLENQFIYPSPNLASPWRLREGEGGVN